MKKRTVWKRTLAMMMAVMGIVIPMAAEETHAVSAPMTVTVPEVQGRIAVSAALAIPGAIVGVVRCVGSIAYATKNSDGTLGDWMSLMTAHMSGNADEIEGLSKLQDVMLEQHKMTQEAIADLKNDIADFRKDVSNQLAQLENAAEYIYLRTALNQFYTEFFVSAYAELENAYLNVVDALNDPTSNDAVIRAKMDDLYMKAYKLKNLQGYITGEINFENKSILDLYYEYLLRSGNVQPGNSDEYHEILAKCQDFTLKLFAADAFQRYCLAYASSYQLNYVYDNMDDMIEQGSFIGYVLDGTLDGFSNKMTLQEIKRNIASMEAGGDTVSARIAAHLSKLYLLDRYVGYSENGAQYFVNIVNNKVSAYYGSSYQAYVLPTELQALFPKDFSFVVSDESAADVTDEGHITLKNAAVGTTFTISYVYGEGVLETPLTVYSTHFTVAEKTWAGGYGNAEAPYLISSVAHLKAFASNSYYWASDVHVKLINDLDASGQTFSKITAYNGSFDGNNHVISNISSSAGLFETNNGEIKNLILDSAKITVSGTGSVSVGAIVDINNGKIENCHVKRLTMDVYRHNYKSNSSAYSSFTIQAGGIAGSVTNGTIRNCSVINSSIKAQISTREFFDGGRVFSSDDMTITMKIYVGGIVGLTSNALVENNYVEDTTISTRTYAKYYKWSLLWEHTYNRVNANVYTGIIAGNQSGSFYDNFYYNSGNSSNPIDKLAANKEDGSFVTGGVSTGVQGVSLSSKKTLSCVTSIGFERLPYQTFYHSGETVNPSGLVVVDNFGNPVYGYTIVSENTDENGTKTVTVRYNGLQKSFSIEIGCLHKNIEYVYENLDEESLIFYTAGIFCNDCSVYTNGREAIVHSSCEDDDKDHICDICSASVGTHAGGVNSHDCAHCGKTVTECADTDKDHACDICGASMGTHTGGTGTHTCAYCGKAASECADMDKDHVCDICGASVGMHAGGVNSHNCAHCGKIVTECADTNKDHACDVCGASMGIHEPDVNGHICSYCLTKASDCIDVNKDHTCDQCGTFMGQHAETSYGHDCAYCGKIASACRDTDKNHICDVCSKILGDHTSLLGSHTCSYCNAQISVCADANNDGFCDVCNVEVKRENKAIVIGAIGVGAVALIAFAFALGKRRR